MNLIKSLVKLVPTNFQLKIMGLLMRRMIPHWRTLNANCDPRKWSNAELRTFAKYFSGNVINIAGGEDRDKEAGKYQDYFLLADSYTVANYPGQYANSPEQTGILLDLSRPLVNNSPLLEVMMSCLRILS